MAFAMTFKDDHIEFAQHQVSKVTLCKHSKNCKMKKKMLGDMGKG